MKKLLILLLLSFSPSVFAGCISGDCANGYGTYVWGNGDRYVGEYKNGKREGQGTMTYASGDKHVGEYKNGVREGYAGQYKNDKREEKVTSFWRNNKLIKSFENLSNREFKSKRSFFIFLLILTLSIFLILLKLNMTSNSESRILLKKQREQNKIELKKQKEKEDFELKKAKEVELKRIEDERIQKEKAEEAELKRIEDERIQREKKAIELKKQKEKEEFELKQELDLVKAVYAEKEIEEQKKIEEKLKLQQEQLEQERQQKIEQLRKLNFEDVKEKKEKLEKEIGISDKVSNKDILRKEEVKDKKNYANSVDILSITNFENKIKNAIPFHQLRSLPPIGNIEGYFFECGCGSKHKMHFNKHLFLADMGMFKAVFLSIDCEYINALKYKSMFSNDIENLFSTKWLKKENEFGFTKSNLTLDGGMPLAINMMLSEAN